MKKFLFCLCLVPGILFAAPLLATSPASPPAPAPTPSSSLERDLGHGLVYYRVHTLPADLPPAPARHGATIVDLRYTHSEAGATVALGAWLRFHSSTATPVFVLLNAGSAPMLLDYFGGNNPTPGLVTLGTAASGFVPDIVLKIHPAAERAAYQAFDHGTPVETLLTDPVDKPRHDEASIAKERNAPADDTSDADSDIALPGEAAPVAPAAPRPVIDYTLLRAVQLHHALLALRKL